MEQTGLTGSEAGVASRRVAAYVLLVGLLWGERSRRGRAHPVLLGRGAKGGTVLRFGVGSVLLELIGGLGAR